MSQNSWYQATKYLFRTKWMVLKVMLLSAMSQKVPGRGFPQMLTGLLVNQKVEDSI